jgi:hypothetical protein
MGCRCLKTVKPARQSVCKQNERATDRRFHLVSVASDGKAVSPCFAATWLNIDDVVTVRGAEL